MLDLKHSTIDVEKVIALVKQTDEIIFDEKLVSDVQVKGRADYVTQVDFRVQEFIQCALKEMYPDIYFIGEESKWQEWDPAKSYWILDPIDGTTNLMHHYQMSAVSLGLYEKGRVTFGLVYNPFHKEMFLAAEGQGAYLNGKPIHVAAVTDIKEALVSFGSTPYEKERASYLFRIFERIFVASSGFRRSGSAALDLCYVACGRVDIYIEQRLKPWDYAAGMIIVQEAGGAVDPWYRDGKVDPLQWADLIAHNGKLKEQAYRLMHDE